MSRRNRMTKAEQRRFDRLAWEWLEGHGATLDHMEPANPIYNIEESRTYILPTTVGGLSVRPFGDWLACRWEDVPRALAKIGRDSMNPYSGKWNHHCFERCTAEEALDYMLLQITRFIPNPCRFCLPTTNGKSWIVYARDESLKLTNCGEFKNLRTALASMRATLPIAA